MCCFHVESTISSSLRQKHSPRLSFLWYFRHNWLLTIYHLCLLAVYNTAFSFSEKGLMYEFSKSCHEAFHVYIIMLQSFCFGVIKFCSFEQGMLPKRIKKNCKKNLSALVPGTVAWLHFSTNPVFTTCSRGKAKGPFRRTLKYMRQTSDQTRNKKGDKWVSGLIKGQTLGDGQSKYNRFRSLYVLFGHFCCQCKWILNPLMKRPTPKKVRFAWPVSQILRQRISNISLHATLPLRFLDLIDNDKTDNPPGPFQLTPLSTHVGRKVLWKPW